MKKLALPILVFFFAFSRVAARPGIFAPDQLFVTIPQRGAIIVGGASGFASEPASKAIVVWSVTSTPSPGQAAPGGSVAISGQRSITQSELDAAAATWHKALGNVSLEESMIEAIPGTEAGVLRAEIDSPTQQVLADIVNLTSSFTLSSLRLQLNGIWYRPRTSCSTLDARATDAAHAQAHADASAAAKALGLNPRSIDFLLPVQRLTPTACSATSAPTIIPTLFTRPQAPLGQATRYDNFTALTHTGGEGKTFERPSTDEETAWLNSNQTSTTTVIAPGISTTSAVGVGSITVVPDAVLLLGILYSPEPGATPVSLDRFARAQLVLHPTQSSIRQAALGMGGSADIEVASFSRSCAARDAAIRAAAVRAAQATAASARLAGRRPGRILLAEVRSVTSDIICGSLPTSANAAMERLDPGIGYPSPWSRFGFFNADVRVIRQMPNVRRVNSLTSVTITRDASLSLPAKTATLSIDFSGRGEQAATFADAQPILNVLSQNGVAPSGVRLSTQPVVVGMPAVVHIEADLPLSSPSYVRHLGEAITSNEGYPRFHAFSQVIFGVPSCEGVRDRARRAAFNAAARAAHKSLSELQTVNEVNFEISEGRCGNAPSAGEIPVARNGHFEETNGGNVIVKDQVQLIYFQSRR